MSPYLTAHALYHAGEPPPVSWTQALDFHLQHGVVISEPDLFIMARMVDAAQPDEHATLILHPPSACWHIWAAVGNLRKFIELGSAHGAMTVTWQRRNGRLHVWPFERLRVPQ